MNKLFVPFLPPWVETGLQPAFYDRESGTVLQQVARMYHKVNQLIRNFNELSKETKETVEDYILRFNDLKDFVDDYFDNLDVQEEINNKLDAMADAGTLSDIISQYLNSTAVFGYDTVADMVDAPNLTNGSFARTLGYSAKNDGGGALYKIRTITNDDVIDGTSIISMNDAGNTLIAELITEPIIFAYDTVADMTDAPNLVNGTYVRTLGYTSIDDGGGALYVITNSNDTADGGSVIDLDSGLQAHLITDVVTPEMFGAKCNGTNDDSIALKKAISYAITSKKVLHLLEKTYTITSHSQYYFNVHITGDCTVIGAGKDKSIIAVKSDIGGLTHVLNLDHAGNVTLSGFSIDGGIDISDPAYEDDVFCAGIRLDDTDYVTIKDVAVRNTSGYGISLAQGSTQRLVIEDVVVENTGRDGIDTKNFDDSNGVFTFNNVIVRNVGLHIDEGAGTDQCGIDIRCYGANLSNIRCEDIGGITTGIRARITTEAQGTGGEFNNLSNIVCISKSGEGSEGIALNAKGCNVNNIIVKGFNVGFRATKENVRLTNAYISDCLVSAIRQDDDGLVINNITCEKIYNDSWAMLDVRIGTLMATNVVFGDCKGAVGVADGTVGVYLCNCYLKGTASTRFAFGSLANRTGKIHTNSTCVNITIS